MLRVYLKDSPEKLIHQSPRNAAFEKHYYAQPKQDGGIDHNSLEDLFSTLESKWPMIVEKLHRQDNVNETLEEIFQFIALQRVRVPAARDASEAMLAVQVQSTLGLLDATGRLPPKPPGFEDILKRIEVSIDPHRSIHAMAEMMRGVGRLLDLVGIGALKNLTERPFVTSDNPVIWFDPSIAEAKMLPYTVSPTGPIVLLFPVSPKLMIYGHSSMRSAFASYGFRYSDIVDSSIVENMNRNICRFAYKTIFAQAGGQEELVRECAGTSPVLESQVLSTATRRVIFFQTVFGKRPKKPKWDRSGS
jgi:uncharacterized protein DUF4238